MPDRNQTASTSAGTRVDLRQLTYPSLRWETAFRHAVDPRIAMLPALVACFFGALIGYTVLTPAAPAIAAALTAATAVVNAMNRRRAARSRRDYGPLTDGCVPTATYDLIIRIDRSITDLNSGPAAGSSLTMRERLADVIRAAQTGTTAGSGKVARRAHHDAENLIRDLLTIHVEPTVQKDCA